MKPKGSKYIVTPKVQPASPVASVNKHGLIRCNLCYAVTEE